MKVSLGAKLTLAFGVIILLMVASSAVNYLSVNESRDIYHRIADVRMGTVLAGKDLTRGIYQSLAALRGYLVLGDDPAMAVKMRGQREQAWQGIDDALDRYHSLSQHWTEGVNHSRLEEIQALLAEFRQAQQSVEEMAHTGANIPAYRVLLAEAAPRASRMLDEITGIIDAEAHLAATPERKALLKNLADTRGSLAEYPGLPVVGGAGLCLGLRGEVAHQRTAGGADQRAPGHIDDGGTTATLARLCADPRRVCRLAAEDVQPAPGRRLESGQCLVADPGGAQRIRSPAGSQGRWP